MVTPVGGAISFQDLFTEFRGSGVGAVYALSMADMYSSGLLVASTVTSVPTLGAISMSQFYGIARGAGAPSRTSIVITVLSNTFTSNLNLYNIALSRGYSTGLTDVVLYVSSNALVGSAGSSYTETVSVSLSSGSGAYTVGNLVNNSGNMSDGAFWGGGPFNQGTTSTSIISGVYGIVSPNGTNTGILAVTQTTLSTNDYWQMLGTTMNATTNYCISVWARGFGSSIGQKISLGSAQGQSAITLTAGWQRMITNVAGSGAQRWLLYTNGGAAAGVYPNNMLLTNQTIFLWGPQITTSVSTTANQQYVETTGSGYISPAGAPTLTGSYNIYTTSETLTTSYAVSVPARFNSGDTVKIINAGFIVGESGKGGMGGGVAAAPANGYPTPTAGKAGGRGGDALGAFRPVIIDNTGTIAGGGGGGGGGGAGPGTTPKGAAASYNGGMGGGGAGADSNPGYTAPDGGYANGIPAAVPVASYTVSPTVTFTAGTGGIRAIGATSTATPGANGGAIGTTGSTSTASPLGAAAPGGPPGHYLVGSPFVTWTSTGTRSGSVG